MFYRIIAREKLNRYKNLTCKNKKKSDTQAADTEIFSYPFFKIHGQEMKMNKTWDWHLRSPNFYSDCRKQMK